jgi:hypothetical protein
MPKKQTAITKEQAIANARVYYEQLEMKKKGLQQSTKAAPSTTPKVSAPMARGKGLPPRSPTVQFCKDDSEAKSKGKAFYLQMMEKEQMKRDATKKSSVETRSKASARTSARVAPSVASVPSSHATRLTAQERIRLQQFYQTLQEKEDQKQYPKYHATASSYLPSSREARSNVPTTVFFGASDSLPRSQPTLDAEEASRVYQFYETMRAQEGQKRVSSGESVASSFADDDTSFVHTNSRGHRSRHYQEPKASKRHDSTPHESRQLVIDGMAIFVACFLVKNFSVVFPSLLGKLFLYSFQQMTQVAVTCGSIALKALLVSFVASVVLLVGRSSFKNGLLAPSGTAPKQFAKILSPSKSLSTTSS